MDWMIDIETLSTEGMPALLEISCVSFCRTYYSKWEVDWVGCVELNASIDSNTVDWHKRQGTDLYRRGLPIEEVVVQLISRIKSGGITTVWANSPSFDLEILKKYFDKLGYDCPWKYHQERDVRTVRKIFNEKLNNNHDSYQDCLNQIELVKKCLTRIK